MRTFKSKVKAYNLGGEVDSKPSVSEVKNTVVGTQSADELVRAFQTVRSEIKEISEGGLPEGYSLIDNSSEISSGGFKAAFTSRVHSSNRTVEQFYDAPVSLLPGCKFRGIYTGESKPRYFAPIGFLPPQFVETSKDKAERFFALTEPVYFDSRKGENCRVHDFLTPGRIPNKKDYVYNLACGKQVSFEQTDMLKSLEFEKGKPILFLNLPEISGACFGWPYTVKGNLTEFLEEVEKPLSETEQLLLAVDIAESSGLPLEVTVYSYPFHIEEDIQRTLKERISDADFQKTGIAAMKFLKGLRKAFDNRPSYDKMTENQKFAYFCQRLVKDNAQLSKAKKDFFLKIADEAMERKSDPATQKEYKDLFSEIKSMAVRMQSVNSSLKITYDKDEEFFVNFKGALINSPTFFIDHRDQQDIMVVNAKISEAKLSPTFLINDISMEGASAELSDALTSVSLNDINAKFMYSEFSVRIPTSVRSLTTFSKNPAHGNSVCGLYWNEFQDCDLTFSGYLLGNKMPSDTSISRKINNQIIAESMFSGLRPYILKLKRLKKDISKLETVPENPFLTGFIESRSDSWLINSGITGNQLSSPGVESLIDKSASQIMNKAGFKIKFLEGANSLIQRLLVKLENSKGEAYREGELKFFPERLSEDYLEMDPEMVLDRVIENVGTNVFISSFPKKNADIFSPQYTCPLSEAKKGWGLLKESLSSPDFHQLFSFCYWKKVGKTKDLGKVSIHHAWWDCILAPFPSEREFPVWLREVSIPIRIPPIMTPDLGVPFNKIGPSFVGILKKDAFPKSGPTLNSFVAQTPSNSSRLEQEAAKNNLRDTLNM